MTSWHTRTETPADTQPIRAVLAAAFPTAEETDLVEALRADPGAWIRGLSIVAESAGEVIGHALLTRCAIGPAPALALAPVAVVPRLQGRGVGAAAVRAAPAAARDAGEHAVVVLGDPAYYSRFGFTPAADAEVTVAFPVPEGALQVLGLDPARPLPSGPVRYPAAFGLGAS